MKRFLGIVLLIAVPQLASAKVYMCTDPATGKTVFTDVACAATSSREEVRVDATNLDSGKRYRKQGKRKAWNSQIETRLSGSEYNEKRREITERGTAQVN